MTKEPKNDTIESITKEFEKMAANGCRLGVDQEMHEVNLEAIVAWLSTALSRARNLGIEECVKAVRDFEEEIRKAAGLKVYPENSSPYAERLEALLGEDK